MSSKKSKKSSSKKDLNYSSDKIKKSKSSTGSLKISSLTGLKSSNNLKSNRDLQQNQDN